MLVPARAERGSGGERQNGVHLPRATSPPMTRLNCLALQGTSPGHTPVCVPSGMRQGPKGILPAAAHHAAALAFSIGHSTSGIPDADMSAIGVREENGTGAAGSGRVTAWVHRACKTVS